MPNGEHQIISPDGSHIFDTGVNFLSLHHQCENPYSVHLFTNGTRFEVCLGGGGAEPRRILLQTLKRLSATRPKAQDSFCKHIRVTLFLWTQSPVRVDGAVKSIPVMPNELCSLGPLGRELRTSTLQFIDACLLKIVSDCETQHRKHEVT